MARFFIDRPVFAIVIAIVIVILGVVAIPNLPIAAFPEVVPPVVQITASYLGGNSIDLEKTVAQPIEEQLAGLDGMMYFLSSSANNGSITIDVTFQLGTNPDTATVQTQNKVNIALPRLPPEVQRQGVVVKKVSTAFLMVVGLVSPDDRYDSLFLNNYAQINLLNQIGSLPGVGDSRLSFAAGLLDARLGGSRTRWPSSGLTATDISNAINAQNRQNPAGALGQAPAPPGTAFQYPVNAPGRLVDPAAVRRHRAARAAGRIAAAHSRHRQSGAGRVDLSRFQPRSAASRRAMSIVFLSPGANAVETANQVKAFMAASQAELSGRRRLRHSLRCHACSCAPAIQDVRPDAARRHRPGHFGGVHLPAELARDADPAAHRAGGRHGNVRAVPAAGLLHQHHQHVRSGAGHRHRGGRRDRRGGGGAAQYRRRHGRRARRRMRAMDQVSAPVVAIACILAAVFIPVAFLGGISGQIYRQFALTIAGFGAALGVQRAVAESRRSARCC